MYAREKKYKKRRTDVQAMISKALAAPSEGSSTTFPGTLIAESHHYNEAKEVIDRSRGLWDKYEKIERMIQDAANAKEDGAQDNWEKEVKNQERELERGRKCTLKEVHRMLGMEVKGASEGEMEDDDEQDVHGLHDKNQLKDAIQYAERGVKRMTKALPMDTNI